MSSVASNASSARTDRTLVRDRLVAKKRTDDCGCGAWSTSDQITELLRKRERVCVFIDNSNLFHAIKFLGSEIGNDKRLDYIRLRDELTAGRRADIRFYYSAPQEEDEKLLPVENGQENKRRHTFYDFLSQRLGYFMIELPLRERSGYNPTVAALVKALREKGVPDSKILQITNQRPYWLRQVEGESVVEEKGLDCEIVYDMVKLSQSGHYDTFVLVSGDEDYARTVRKLRNETGIRIEVAFFVSKCSAVLRRDASEFTDLFAISNLFNKVY